LLYDFVKKDLIQQTAVAVAAAADDAYVKGAHRQRCQRHSR